MRIMTLKEIGKIFIEFGHKIENNECETDIETLSNIASKMIHIKKYEEDMIKDINCSRPTLYRMIADGRLPKPHKEAGKKQFWYWDEVLEHIDNYKKKHNIDSII